MYQAWGNWVGPMGSDYHNNKVKLGFKTQQDIHPITPTKKQIILTDIGS
jgi:hypothetical protein